MAGEAPQLEPKRRSADGATADQAVDSTIAFSRFLKSEFFHFPETAGILEGEGQLLCLKK